MGWINVKERLPKEEQYVLAGNINWAWIYQDVMYFDKSFILRESTNTGGKGGFLQLDTKDDTKDHLKGFECFPTHWMPAPPSPRTEIEFRSENGIYMAKFPDGYRVGCGMAIDNTDYWKYCYGEGTKAQG